MRRLSYLMATVAAGFMLCSCGTDLSEVWDTFDSYNARLTTLETTVSNLNTQIKALEFVKNGSVIVSFYKDDDVYHITLSNGDSFEIAANGTPGNAPLLKVGADGYWMADYGDGKGYVYVLDASGNKATSTGKSPVLGVNSDGYWTVDGTLLKDASGNPVKAVVKEADSFFTSVKTVEGGIEFVLKTGETIVVPVAPAFSFKILGYDGGLVEFEEDGETAVQTWNIEAVNIVDAIITAPDGWKVSIADNKLTVVSPGAVTKALSVSTDDSVISIYAVSAEGYSVIVKMPVKLITVSYNKNSYYSMWNAGKSITIAGTTYTQSEDLPATLVSESGDLEIWGSGIYFLAEGVSVNCKVIGCTSAASTCVVVGDKPGTRSSIVFTGDPNQVNAAAADVVVLYNLVVDSGNHDNKLFRTYNNRNLNLYVDNCRFNYGSAILDSGSDGQVINNLVFMNSEIDLSGTTTTGHMSPMLRYWKTTEGAGTSVVFKNNAIFASSSKRLCVIGNTSLTAANVKYDKVVFEDNCFYNVNSSTAAMVGVLDVNTSVSVKNNLAYVPSGNRLAFVIASNGTRAEFLPRCTITEDNKINTDAHSSQTGWGVGFLVGWGTGSDGEWLNTKYYISENPFVSFDTTTGAFVKKSTYSSNGAQR